MVMIIQVAKVLNCVYGVWGTTERDIARLTDIVAIRLVRAQQRVASKTCGVPKQFPVQS
jgi:hypothetical protein